MPRSAAIQIMSNADADGAEVDPVTIIRQFYAGTLPALEAGSIPCPVCGFRDGYDVLEDAT